MDVSDSLDISYMFETRSLAHKNRYEYRHGGCISQWGCGCDIGFGFGLSNSLAKVTSHVTISHFNQADNYM
jgi:hypothetical protein